MNYFNQNNTPFDFQKVQDRWSFEQPIVMVTSTYLDPEQAKETVGTGSLFPMLPIQALSFIPKDSPYRYTGDEADKMEKVFYDGACKVEIETEAGSLHPYVNTIYVPSLFYQWDKGDRKVRSQILEDIYYANEKFHQKDTICFFDVFEGQNESIRKELISNELKEFFNQKENGILQNVVADVF